MANFQLSEGSKGVLKGLAENIKAKIREEVDLYVKNDINNKLGTKIRDGGYSPYDEFRKYQELPSRKNKEHMNTRWYIRARKSNVSISYELRNRAPYAKYLYTDTPSSGHSGGYRSAYPHVPVKVLARDNGHYYYKHIAGKRDNQLDKAKWNKIQGQIKSGLTKAVSKAVKRYNK